MRRTYQTRRRGNPFRIAILPGSDRHIPRCADGDNDHSGHTAGDPQSAMNNATARFVRDYRRSAVTTYYVRPLFATAS
ncbi:hypothetical protein [Roseovarius arcticus]|uniref:hypothetical protein n=1 Tax=Roseovarius arcticus TaxID=2547404 RepID=UPI001110A385|nr:hypothetical protein [Roseovarius arcticus]